MGSDLNEAQKKRLFTALTVVGCFVIIAGLFAVALLALGARGPATLGDVWTLADDRDRAELQNFLQSQVGGIHDTVPDPEIGRVLQRNVTKPFGGVEVRTNNAGMRDDRAYGPKAEGTFRIIVLGDSFAFGHEGLEEDRVGEQLEALLRAHATVPGDLEVEVLTIAQGSWTGVNETAYMVSHFTAYDPDLVIALLVPNDLDDTQGVRGFGAVTNSFSPEYRDDGSTFFSLGNPAHYGFRTISLLYGGLGPESIRRWNKVFSGFARLERVVEAVDARLLLTVFDPYASIADWNPMSLWRDLVIEHYDGAQLTSPLLFVDPYLEPDSIVGVHPNRRGHATLATHYAHALEALGWIDVQADAPLPVAHPGMSMDMRHAADADRIRRLRAGWVDAHLRPQLDFTRIDRAAAMSIYAGALPDGEWISAARRMVFLLARPEAAHSIEVRVVVPERPELYPFTLDVSVQGYPAGRFELADVGQAGEHTWRAPLPGELPASGALEVELRAHSHWSTIEDATMRSYYPLRVRLVE